MHHRGARMKTICLIGTGWLGLPIAKELAERGFYKGAPDGQFGPKTEAAVTAYKQAKGFGAGPKAGKRVLDDLGIGL